MASHEFGGVFGLNAEPLQSLPATVQRRKDKLPRTPTSTAAPESTETPYTSDDTYNDEPDTPTMTRKQRSQPQPQPQAPTPSLIDTLIAQNQRAEESSRRAEESNRQMMQALMHTIERLAPSQPQPQLPSQPQPQPTYLPPQPIANLYETTI
jgi:hypothetical protein